MRATFLADGRVRVVLARGEALAHVEGSGIVELVPQPGLVLWDALVASGVAIAPATRTATGAALHDALEALGRSVAWEAAVAAAKPSVRTYWASAYRTLLPETSPKLARLAGMADVNVAALFDAALAGAR